MKKLFHFFLAALVLFGGFAFFSAPLCAVHSNAEATATTLIAASDFQSGSLTQRQTNMREILGSMADDGITSADGFFFCGDFSDTLEVQADNEAGVNALLEVTEEVAPLESTILLQGNHDVAAGALGMSPSGNNDPASGKYGVFVINEDDYMWKNNDEERIKNTARNLIDYLNEKLEARYTKPVFVLSHLPLHYSMRTVADGDGRYAGYIFHALNEASEKGLNVFFLFGHDHSNGWDDYLGGSSVFLTKGDSILIAQNSKTAFKEEELNFTYLNAGYVGYYSKHNTNTDAALTMTSYTIDKDSVLIKRYDKNGVHNLKSVGVTNAYKGENTYEPNTKSYQSPQDVALKSITDASPMVPSFGRAVKITSTHEGIKYSFDKENSLVLTLSIGQAYKLKTLEINGVSIDPDDIVDGKYTVKAKALNTVNATYETRGKYKITRENDSSKGTLKIDPSAFLSYYEGTEITVTLLANKGYAVKAVYLNGRKLEPVSENVYKFLIEEGENFIKTEYEAVAAPDPENNETKAPSAVPQEKTGCGSALNGYISVALIVTASAFLSLRKRLKASRTK
ncbi:MAG: metallophosphoesterase [Clostridia bacterium]|nr:metallophosphoesterase [Clostridia bacterium]